MAVYSVLQILTYLNEVVGRDSLSQDLWVRGEVANLARPSSGHSYFSLRDSSETLRCVLFRREYTGVEGMSDLVKNGSSVVAHGRITIYKARGDLQFVVDMVRPEGMGELQLKLEQLKSKLEREGLFDPSRKRPLPTYPDRIAVITSPGGAVWKDICTVVGRRYPLVELVLVPTNVHGPTAVSGIVEAFAVVGQLSNIGVTIVARGGGSLEDLWPFNEEDVARVIYSSQVPVISAIGHETDLTIADMVADRRAPTPSVAAEMAVPDQMELAARLKVSQKVITSRMSNILSLRLSSINRLGSRFWRLSPDFDELRSRTRDHFSSVSSNIQHNFMFKIERASGLKMRLESLSPTDTLRRGYAIVQRSMDETIVNDVSQVSAGDFVNVTLSRGGFGAKVSSVVDDIEVDGVNV